VSEQAPFVPPTPEQPESPTAEAESVASSHILKNRGFQRLWGAQCVSSLGDWVGLLAILFLAQRVAGSGSIALVMIARMLPGFVLAPLGGALLDRWDRRRVLVACDVGRACLLVALPFADNLAGLVCISFALEVLTLLWGPAKDASVPNIVAPEQLSAANSLGLAAAYGTFPLASIAFAALAGISKWLGGFAALSRLSVDQETLAIWVDALTFFVSAFLVMGLRLPRVERNTTERVSWMQTYRDVIEGLSFMRSNAIVRGVMVGIAGGLLGGGAMIPLGPAFAKQVLDGGAGTFGLLMTALGVGAAIGVPILLWLQRRLPKQRVFAAAVIATGGTIVAVALVATLGTAVIIVALVGATAASAYVTGFTLLQESVSDEMRGRIFGALYTVVRLCLLLSLTIAPLMSSILDRISRDTIHRKINFGGNVSISLPGVRLALVVGGIITIISGFAAGRRMRRANAPAVVEGAG
jgi:dTMP kinase